MPEMKITIVDELIVDGALPQEFADFEFSDDEKSRQLNEPIQVQHNATKIGGVVIPSQSMRGDIWVYRDKIVQVIGAPVRDRDGRVKTEVQYAVLKHQKAFDKMKEQIGLFEAFEKFKKFDSAISSRLDPIPEDVRMFVWRRDQGRYTACPSNKRLEFDHIIPLAEDGSNTERNLQLLCETCNRKKGKTV